MLTGRPSSWSPRSPVASGRDRPDRSTGDYSADRFPPAAPRPRRMRPGRRAAVRSRADPFPGATTVPHWPRPADSHSGRARRPRSLRSRRGPGRSPGIRRCDRSGDRSGLLRGGLVTIPAARPGGDSPDSRYPPESERGSSDDARTSRATTAIENRLMAICSRLRARSGGGSAPPRSPRRRRATPATCIAWSTTPRRIRSSPRHRRRDRARARRPRWSRPPCHLETSGKPGMYDPGSPPSRSGPAGPPGPPRGTDRRARGSPAWAAVP